MSQIDINALWGKVVDDVKHKVIHPTLWKTLEIAQPITIDGSIFVLGLRPANYSMSGHLTSAEHRNAIESSLMRYTGKRLSLRVIEGTTVEEWEHVVSKAADADKIAEETQKRRAKESAVIRTWEGLYELVGRKYASLPMRQFPQNKAKYIEEVIVDLADAMDELIPLGTVLDELTERSLARVIDRVGTVTDVPPALIALEIQRLREKRR